MAGQQLWNAAHHGDAAKVGTLLSTQGAQSFMDYQEALGITPLHMAAGQGHVAVSKQLIAARCNVNLQTEQGITSIHASASQGHEAVTKQLIVARCNVDLQAENWYAVTLMFRQRMGSRRSTRSTKWACCRHEAAD
jgi:ankyrin repeat protein